MREFKADTSLNRAQANGHLMRFGHVLKGYYPDEEFPTLIRTCCN